MDTLDLSQKEMQSLMKVKAARLSGLSDFKSMQKKESYKKGGKKYSEYKRLLESTKGYYNDLQDFGWFVFADEDLYIHRLMSKVKACLFDLMTTKHIKIYKSSVLLFEGTLKDARIFIQEEIDSFKYLRP